MGCQYVHTQISLEKNQGISTMEKTSRLMNFGFCLLILWRQVICSRSVCWLHSKGIRNMRRVIDLAVMQAWVWTPALLYRPGHGTKPVWTSGSLSVRIGGGRGVWRFYMRWWLRKCLAHRILNTCSRGASAASQTQCLGASKRDAIVTYVVCNFKWLDFKIQTIIINFR